MATYNYKTDSVSGQVEANSASDALEQVMATEAITDDALAEGAWAWVDDGEGDRLSIGDMNEYEYRHVLVFWDETDPDNPSFVARATDYDDDGQPIPGKTKMDTRLDATDERRAIEEAADYWGVEMGVVSLIAD